jgi:hypothetical protein
MDLTIKEFISIPAHYKDRIDSIKKLRPRLINIYLFEEFPVIKYQCNNYTLNFQLIGKEVNEDNLIKLSCTCPSFNFEFANTLFVNNALFQPRNFYKAIQTIPKKKNKYNIVSGCKHSIACINDIYKRMDKIQIFLNKSEK